MQLSETRPPKVIIRFPLIISSSFLLFIASPGQFSWGPLAWIALLPFLLVVSRIRPGKAFKAGLICGIVYYCSILYWITIVLGKYGGLPLWVSLPALFLLSCYMSIFMAIFAAGLSWSRAKLPMIWVAPPLWVALDFLRAHLFTGFPWLDLGYSQYQYPELIQLADLTGHYGVTFLIVMVNCLFVTLWQLYKSKNNGPSNLLLYEFLPAAIILIAAFSYNQVRYLYFANLIQDQPSIQVALVQGNIDQSEKWLPHIQEETIDTYLALSNKLAEKKPELIIWPETALPFFPLDHPLFKKITDKIMQPNGPVFITGAPHFTNSEIDQQIKYFNSAFILTPTSDKENIKGAFSISRYDKQHLVPFGEYVPFSQFIPSSMPIVHTMGNFSPGTSTEPFSCHNAKIGVLICYESIFPDLAREEVENGATLLVNLTNDAWYGRSSAPWQQLSMVIFRAIENRKSFARAANTGISCFIDPLGRQLQLSPLFEPDAMVASLPLLTEASPFTSFGHYFPLLCLLSLIPMIFIQVRSSNRNGQN